ncbi:hypothetical protein B9T31_09705 [Acinetobacter sp. ANC 4558]|uniref:hypothetical protein n=1 Tax=Acinetobacter sp. ANC 4558 TaxID=1977876 RepID=UPI000A3571C0|nr:hypothetical protein [Acinetobacter sp. ANC 4558]OTG85858.1 hypothetical protein B9T31_09705 [Acinetobacter sp. ANC 4558]
MSISEFQYDGEAIVVGSENWKEWILSADPFEGDFDDSQHLSDKIVKTRKATQLCSDCLSICVSGTYNRVITVSEHGSLITNRYCQECCTAMAFDELHQDYKQYDEDSENYPEEEIMLIDVRQQLRTVNENFLIKKLGKRYFDKPKEDLYKVMIEAREQVG